MVPNLLFCTLMFYNDTFTKSSSVLMSSHNHSSLSGCPHATNVGDFGSPSLHQILVRFVPIVGILFRFNQTLVRLLIRRGSDWIGTKFRRSERIVRGFDGVRDYRNPPHLVRGDIQTDWNGRVRTSRQTTISWKYHYRKLRYENSKFGTIIDRWIRFGYEYWKPNVRR